MEKCIEDLLEEIQGVHSDIYSSASIDNKKKLKPPVSSSFKTPELQGSSSNYWVIDL
jgi:hypothetical protein